MSGAAHLGSRALRGGYRKIMGSPHKPSGAGCVGRGGARERSGVFRASGKRSKADFGPTMVRLVGVATFLLALLLILGLDTAPPPGDGVAEGAAMVAAGQTYDRVVEATGDRDGAEQAAERVYREVLDGWEP